MRYLGIDYGAKRIGLALSDEDAQFAFPNETVPNDATSVDRINNIILKNHVKGIIIGDTRAGNGADNPITGEAKEFARQLEANAGIALHFSREAWSSIEASRFAPKGKEHDDAAAAAIILQRFLDNLPQ